MITYAGPRVKKASISVLPQFLSFQRFYVHPMEMRMIFMYVNARVRKFKYQTAF